MKNFKIGKALVQFKELTAQVESLKTQELKDAEKELERVRKAIADFAKAQEANIDKNGVTVELQDFTFWNSDALEVMAVRNPDILTAKKHGVKALIRVK